VSNGECVLTSNAESQSGYLLFDSVDSTPTLFNAQWDYRVFDGSGADGISFNYGPMTSADGGEWGMVRAVLTVSLIEYQGERVELRYNGNIINSTAFTLTGNMYRRVVVNIDSVNFVTVSVGGSNVISTSLANTDYSLRDKTGWRFGFAGRTGSFTNKHSIKNLVISRVDYGTLSPTVSQAPSMSHSPSLNPSISQSPSSPSQLVHKVRVQLDGFNFLHMREVQVYDTIGVNLALNKAASQSSTFNLHYWGSDPASNAVNGALSDYSHTHEEAGMYQFDYANHVILTV
jgi:hypothetical protein